MNKIPKLFFLLIGLPICLLAQPANDDCNAPIHLGVAPACPDSVFFSNVNATASNTGTGAPPFCFNGGAVENDIWFTFTASDTIYDYTITLAGMADGSGAAIVNPQIALYRGDCAGGLAELACASAQAGAKEVELNVEGLTPSITYFLRINDYSPSLTPNWGAFQLCVSEKQPVYTIDEGSSTACSGVLYDSGGPDGDYSNNENHTFTICPGQPHDCILFSLDHYFIEPQDMFGATDQLIFYDGPQANPANIIAQVGNFNFEDDGGGGVCYQVKAVSGCLTVQFISDAQVAFEGFQGKWECSNGCETAQPIAVDANISNQQIIEFVSTPAITASITNIECPQISYGTFQAADPAGLGLERGLLLTTGSLAWAPGPNTDPGNGNFDSDNGAPGDPALDYLSQLSGNDFPSENACIVELDVYAATNELTFEYIFGSEEYQEFVGLEYNDIFAFLISGPGITGDPNISNQLNIAVLPDGNGTPVEINNVNQLANWQYYRNNNNGVATQYDGLTSDFLGIKKSLTARAEVQPCNTYHLKLAIADRGDAFFDSGVFISELKGGTPQLSVNFNSGIDYLAEGCANTPDELAISLTVPPNDTIAYQVEVGGTASLGFDYLLDVPDSVVFLPGETNLVFPITVLSDLETEATETIIIRLANDFGCGEVVYSELLINLSDQLRVEINAGQDTAYICQDSTVRLQAAGADSYFWSPVGLFDDPAVASPAVSPDSSLWVTVEGVLGPCVAYDSIFLQRTVPAIEVQPADSVAICRGDSIQLVANNNVNGAGLLWSPASGLDSPTAERPMATPLENTTYIATIALNGCVFRDSVFIDVAAFDFPAVIPDTAICENYGVQLAEMIHPDSTTTLFQWSPATGLNSDSIAAPLAFPTETTTYQLIAAAANGACSDTASVTVAILAADVDIANPDTVEICRGDSVALSASTNTGDADGLLWSPDDGSLSGSSGLAVVAAPEVSTWYYATFQQGGCTVKDSVFIRVDSLPDGFIMAEPAAGIYCPGDTVQLLSADYESAFYPDIEHFWSPGDGLATADTLLNITLTTQNTTLYRRITTNHACRDTAEILIRVFEGPPASGLQVEGPAGPVCAGDSIRLSAFVAGGGMGQFRWEGSDGSSQAGASVAFGPAEPVAYTLTYVSEGGCDTLATSLAIDVQPGLAVSLEASFPGFANTQQGNPIILDALANQPPPLDFTWTLNQAVIQQGADLFNYEDVLIADPSVYTVFAQNPESGCRDSASLAFDVAPPVIEVPNAFSPNGDGVNDFFTYVAAGNVRQVLELKVFNRWGQLVYDGDSSNPADFKGWDGTFKGQPQPSEVYFYLIRLERYDGMVEVRRGEVGLLR